MGKLPPLPLKFSSEEIERLYVWNEERNIRNFSEDKMKELIVV